MSTKDENWTVGLSAMGSTFAERAAYRANHQPAAKMVDPDDVEDKAVKADDVEDKAVKVRAAKSRTRTPRK